MRPFEDLRSGLTPAVEQLRESWDETYPEPLRGRELAVEAATAAVFLAVAASLAVFVQSGPAFDAPLAVALVATYAVLAMVRFPIGYGFTIPTQIVLVPMLFLASARLGPAARGRRDGARQPAGVHPPRAPSKSRPRHGGQRMALGRSGCRLRRRRGRRAGARRVAGAAGRARCPDPRGQRSRDAPRVGRLRHLAEAPAVAVRLGHARGRAAVAGRPPGRDGRRRATHTRCCSCSHSPLCCSSSRSSAARACARRSS